MYIRSSPLRTSELAKVYVVLDEKGSASFGGRIFHPTSGQQLLFTGVFDFLKKLEELYDTHGFPQKTHSIRTFKALKKDRINLLRINKDYETEVLPVMETRIPNSDQKGKATFVIKVLFRQNATWQGKIQWVEENKTQNFRSELEMLKLMDDAIKMTDEGEDDTAKWE